MARINIEEESWVRFYRLAEIMNSNIQTCVGTVALLWHRSQDVIKASGTFEEVADWCGLAKLPEPEQRCWINGLEKARFISSADGGLYLIHGNETQIEARIAKSNRASKGGEALKKKLRELKRLQAGSKPAASTLQACSKGLKARQGKAVQGKAGQGSAGQLEICAEPAELDSAPVPVVPKNDALVPVNLIPGKVIELKQDLMTSWAETYPQEFLELEFKKARSWILSNPAKAPKSNFTKFLNGWFDRGWEQYRKTLKSNPTQLTPEMVAEILGAG